MTACKYGLNLAGPAEFDEQRARAGRAQQWDKKCSTLLQRLKSGARPLVLDLFSGAGGVSEGFRRGGWLTVGVDREHQPDFVRRFGEDAFFKGDALDRELIRRLVRTFKPDAVWASPPCEASSTATFGGAKSKAPKLIAATRDLLEELGLPWVLENVRGASRELRNAVTLIGQDWGLRTERARLFEAGQGVQIARCPWLSAGGEDLRRRCCLGARARFDRLDRFGRRASHPCCSGNIFPILGTSPGRCSEEESFTAMGVDRAHMSYPRLAKAIPPPFAQHLSGQLARHILRERFGVDVPHFDVAHEIGPSATRRLNQLLRGAGDPSASAGLDFLPSVISKASQPQAPKEEATPEEVVVTPPNDEEQWGLTRLAIRELDLSAGGGWSAAWSPRAVCDELQIIRATTRLVGRVSGAKVAGHNVLVVQPPVSTLQAIDVIAEALERDPLTRAVVVCRPADARCWFDATEKLGRVSLLMELGGVRSVGGFGRQLLVRGGGVAVAITIGMRRCRPAVRIDYEDAAREMDLHDPGAGANFDLFKRAVSFTPCQRPQAMAWRAAGFEEEFVRIFEDGASVELAEEWPALEENSVNGDKMATLGAPGARGSEGLPAAKSPTRAFVSEHGQYPFEDTEHTLHAIWEADRAILAGHLEPVPAELVEEARQVAPAHPWLVVKQGEKWRACQDYSLFTNPRVSRVPFSLPSAWDAEKVIGPDSHMAKYDLRDGYWAVPVALRSRAHLMVRHPATGRLLWCRSLPFGYKLSPAIFCRITERVAQMLRTQLAGQGIHIFVYVDDYLVVGDTLEKTLKGMQALEELLDVLGLQWALHKRRGPTRALEFLGILIANLPSLEGRPLMAVAEKRRQRMLELFESWLAKRSPPPTPWSPTPQRLEVAPREMAELLGLLVFIAPCVPHGRVYMQTMLRAFAGLSIDWRGGRVRFHSGQWQKLEVTDSFFADLQWWESALRGCSCWQRPTTTPPLAAIVGTDASDQACGGVAWVDGSREETQLVFTAAEKRRPINFRELYGAVRVVDKWGKRLRGHKLLIDIDNTAAVGAASRAFSKAAEMQEQVRRLVSLAMQHQLEYRPVHCPGVALVRPDALSRGDQAEPPRIRLSREAFGVWERRYGPFTSMMGAEREYQSEGGDGGGETEPAGAGRQEILWAHPTPSSYFATLDLILERLAACGPSSRVSGLVVLPHDPGQGWWRRAAPFCCVVGRYARGSRHLEKFAEEGWSSVPASFPTIILRFPVHVGETLPLSYMLERGTGAGGRAECRTGAGVISRSCPLPAGSLLYCPQAHRGKRSSSGKQGDNPWGGWLFRTLQEYDGGRLPLCERGRAPGRTSSTSFSHSRRQSITFWRGGQHQKKHSTLPPEVDCWLVNAFAAPCDGKSSSLVFDFLSAESMIAQRGAQLDDLAGSSAQAGMGSTPPRTPIPRGALFEEALGDDTYGDECVAMSALRDAKRSRSVPQSENDASPLPQHKPQPSLVSSISGMPTVECRYEGMRCAGCGQAFSKKGKGTRITPGGAGMICDQKSCLANAERLMRREAAERRALVITPQPAPPDAVNTTGASRPRGAAAGATRGSDQRRAQLSERLGENRRARVRRCLEGSCGEMTETAMRCIGVGGFGCKNTLHGVSCAQLSRGLAALGYFKCPTCRLRRCFPSESSQPPPEALEAGLTSMLVELTASAEATGASVSDFQQLEARFMQSIGGDMGAVLPRDDEEVFKAFVSWAVVSAKRARSLNVIVRTASLIMAKTDRPNLTKNPGVKAFIKALHSAHGEEPQAKTAATRRMLRELIHAVIPEGKHSPIVAARLRLQAGLEAMCGFRVGETLGGGDGHGLLACNVRLLTEIGSGGRLRADRDVIVEATLEHSKTKNRRVVTAFGESRGLAMIPLEAIVRQYWQLAGFTIKTKETGGYREEAPDYVVARMSLVALGEAKGEDEGILARLHSELKGARSKELVDWADYILKRGQQRLGGDSLECRYINLAGGHEGCASVNEARTILHRVGIRHREQFSIVPGPLLRASHGGMGLSHMPARPNSSMGKLLAEAYTRVQAQGPDPELDLEGRVKPMWGDHSIRRAADSAARQTRGETGASEEDIDLVFGWNESKHAGKMQLHYESTLDRVRRAAVTSMI